MRGHVLRAAVLIVLASTCTACASAPALRSPSPSLGSGTFVSGAVGTHAMFGATQMGVGTTATVTTQVAPEIDLLARGHATDIFPYTALSTGRGVLFDDALFGGAVGARWTREYVEHLRLGGELFVDYQQRIGSDPSIYLSGIVGLPVAEQFGPGLWAYTDVQLGLALPLFDAGLPFFGFTEIPLGVAWQPMPWLVVLGEAGATLVDLGTPGAAVQGGYGAVSVSFLL